MTLRKLALVKEWKWYENIGVNVRRAIQCITKKWIGVRAKYHVLERDTVLLQTCLIPTSACVITHTQVRAHMYHKMAVRF